MMAENESTKLIFFSTKDDDHNTEILKAIPRLIPETQIMHCSNFNDFSIAVRDLLFGLGVVLIIIRNENELNEILQIRQRLKDHLLLLVLDDSIENLMHQVLKIYPRYTSYIGDDSTNIFLVLKKMISKIQKI